MGVLGMDMASAMEGTMVDMVDMASATATMASVMLSPRLMLIPTSMVDMVLGMDMASAMEGTMVDMVDMVSATDMALAMEGLTMVDMVDMDSMAITAKQYLISSKCVVKFKMLPTLLIINRKSNEK